MFRVECFVDDKKLGDALRALTGIAHGNPIVQPVVNAVKTGNGIAAATGGKPIERLSSALAALKPGTVMTTAEWRVLLKAAGITGVGYITTQAVKEGFVKKTGTTSNARYTVR